MGDTSSWLCPYCNHYAVIGESNSSVKNHNIPLEDPCGMSWLRLQTTVVICPNPICREYVITAELVNVGGGFSSTVKKWNLRPQSRAKPWPSYIPKLIRQDYEEACLICDLSPKASATLSRRCLQGMIRDFHGVRDKPNLYQEIEAIRDHVEPMVWEAMDAVRQIGNIGAHMEKDINLIVEVEPQEASALIELIEMLFKEWYVARNERQQQLHAVIEAARGKQTQQQANDRLDDIQ